MHFLSVSALLILFSGSCLTLLDFTSSQTWSNDYGRFPRSLNNYMLDDACITELRKQMNLEKHASLVYKQMAFHFNSVNVTRTGFAKLFEEQSKEESEHFDKFITYMNLRGAHIGTFNITMPTKKSWGSVLEAIEDAIELEHFVTNEIYRMHRIADKTCKDIHLMNFLENDFVDEQISSINKLMRMANLLRSMGSSGGYGEYQIDRDLYLGKLTLGQI